MDVLDVTTLKNLHIFHTIDILGIISPICCCYPQNFGSFHEFVEEFQKNS